MKIASIFTGFAFGLLLACQGNKTSSPKIDLSAEEFYNVAAKHAGAMQYDSVIILLRQAFEKGLENPMQIVLDSDFYGLIDSPDYRPKIRLLLAEFATDNQALMVRESEPGQPISVFGQIVDESNNTPIKDVSVELVQTDHEGFYFKEKTMWNPRLFAYLHTDHNGMFSFRTIRPGKYKDDDGNFVAAHIHFTLKKDGYRIYGGEFTFEDDPIFKSNGNIDRVPVAKLRDPGNKQDYQVNIPLQVKAFSQPK